MQAGYSEGDWQTVSIAEAVGGNLTWTDVPGAELVLYFEGSAIEILHSRGPEGGDFSIHLDGLSWPPFNGYAEQYLYGTSIQQFNIAPGVHQLVMTNGDGAFWLEAIRVQGTLVIPEPTLPLIHTETFDSINPTVWLFDVKDRVVSDSGNNALHVAGQKPPVMLTQGYIEDVIVEARFSIVEGIGQLIVRHSGQGEYIATLESNGTVSLYRRDTLLATTSITPLSSGRWYTLRLSAIDQVLRVSVNGNEVIRAADPQPLPPGMVMLADGRSTENNLFIDDFNVWGTISSPPVAIPTPALLVETTSFSNPNAEIVFYSMNDFQIYTTDRSGGNRTQLTSTGAINFSPEWSPDGSKIAFVSSLTGGDEIFVMNADGTSLQQVTSGVAANDGITWSPDGDKIAFSFLGDVYTVSPGSSSNKIADDEEDHFGSLTWSPVSNEVLVENTNPEWIYAAIYRMDATSGDLSSGALTGEASDPEWSPDGTQFAYADLELNAIVIRSSSGQFIRQVTTQSGYFPSFSPDASRLVFDTSSGVATVSAMGGTISPIASDGSMPDWRPIDCTSELVATNANTTVLNPVCQVPPPPPNGCIVTLTNPYQAIQVNAYTSPVPARTERIQFAGETQLVSSTYLPYEQSYFPRTFNEGTQLWIDQRYGRDEVDGQYFIVRVIGFNETPDDESIYNGSETDWITGQQLWINSMPFGSSPNDAKLVPVANGNNCSDTSKVPVSQTYSYSNFRHEQIERLRDYGVDVREYETDNPAGTKKEWSISELGEILAGVQATATIFSDFSTRTPSLQPIEAFRTVMDTPRGNDPTNFWLTFVRTSTQRGYCQTDNNTKTVTCYGTILLNPDNTPSQVTRYTVVHELGHVFDDKSNTIKSLTDYISETDSIAQQIIIDARGTVMGVTRCTLSGDTVWIRGERGWGSGPGSDYTAIPLGGTNAPDDVCGTPTRSHTTNFQQNAAPYTGGNNHFGETAADMFLNWVYSAFSDRSWKPRDMVPNSNPLVSCHDIPTGCMETALNKGGTPGTARFNWMNSTQLITGTNRPKGIMRQIFGEHNW
ncbi:MAG: hypothetical protein F9K28_07400 [Bacteroidetes bacterium]|nr:MAG: hypothetical protein F9K28_07400 [Bacteroidota bacterium]